MATIDSINSFLQKYAGVTVVGALTVAFGAGLALARRIEETRYLRQENETLRKTCVDVSPVAGKSREWPLQSLLIPESRVSTLEGYTWLEDQRIYVKTPRPAWRDQGITEAQQLRLLLSDEARAALGWTDLSSHERATMHIWLGEPVVRFRAATVKAGQTAAFQFPPYTLVQRFRMSDLQQLWGFTGPAGRQMVESELNLTSIMQPLFQGFSVARTFQGVDFRVRAIEKSGPALYLATTYRVEGATLETGGPGTVQIEYEQVFLRLGTDEALWATTCVPFIGDPRSGQGLWAREWLMNLRVPVGES